MGFFKVQEVVTATTTQYSIASIVNNSIKNVSTLFFKILKMQCLSAFQALFKIVLYAIKL